MSAFMQSKDHIDLLVTAAIDKDLRWFVVDRVREHVSDAVANGADYLDTYREVTRRATRMDANDIGAMLMAENQRSVSYRYPDSPDDLPGSQDYRKPYQYQPVFAMPPVGVILGAIAGYEYQACEHPEWETSEAYRFCQSLRDVLCMSLPGVDEGWSWERPTSRATA